jgi:hypothetical protein
LFERKCGADLSRYRTFFVPKYLGAELSFSRVPKCIGTELSCFLIKDPIVIMKCRMTSITLFLYFNLCLSEKVDSIPCSFTSTFILTRHILQKCFEYNIVNKRVSVLVINVIFLITYWFYLPVLSLYMFLYCFYLLSLKTSPWSNFGIDWLNP